MRTSIVIDDKLMKATLRVTGLKIKRAAVDLGLRTLLLLCRLDIADAVHYAGGLSSRKRP